jgi:hypothetical protein
MSSPPWLRIPWARHVGARDAARSALAGAQGVSTRAAANVLFEAGGHTILPATVQTAVRGAVEHEATRWMLQAGIAGARGGAAPAVLENAAARVVAVTTVEAAGRQIVRALGVSAVVGAAIDGGWALVAATKRVREGTMSRRQAALHVVREAGTGAAAVALGAAASTTLVALTGGVAAPALFAFGAAAAFGAKAGLNAWTIRSSGAIHARLAPRAEGATPDVTPPAADAAPAPATQP